MKASPLISSFNSGELSPLMAGRSDIAKYASGCALLQNFIPRVQGPITRRAGSHFAAELKDSTDRCWLVRFEFSATQAWVLEFGDLYVRFYTNRGQVESAPSTPYEIVSPYAIADLTNADGTFALKIVQSGDVLYIANQKRTYAPRKLTRLGATNWVFSEYQPAQGPLLEMNGGATTIYASGSTGSVTLTASAALFAASDVGRLVRIAVQNQLAKPWETDKAYSINDLVRYDGKTYKALNAKDSGTFPPIHEQGTAFDGQDGVQWEYQDSGYGMARITAFTSSTQVTASVVTDTPTGLKQLPADVVGSGNATKRWNLGAWSATTEYPASVTFWRDRLWWAGRQRIWGSVPNDFENMAGDFFGQTTLDCAVWAQLQAEDVNEVLWLAGDTTLVIGTPGGEFVGREITTTDALGPSNFKIERHGKRRCRAVQPLAIGQTLCFVQRAGRRLMSMAYRLENDRFSSTDLAVLSDRMTRDGIIDMAWQAEQFSVIWCALSTGKLIGFTYDQDQDVTGWHRQPLGGSGIVESVVTIPSPDGLGEDLWLIVRRTINGSTKRYVEWIGRPWEGPDTDGSGGDAQEDAFYVDSGLTYDGVPNDVMSGLGHLEGQTVQILADGAAHPDRVVASGSVTLNAEYSVVHIGLACPARMISNDLEAGGSAGTSLGKAAKIYRVAVRFLDTLGGFVGKPSETFAYDPTTLEEIDFRVPNDPMNQAPPIQSGVRDVTFPGDWDREKRVEAVQIQPLPMTIVSMAPRLHANDR
jgi:hypothetical protein